MTEKLKMKTADMASENFEKLKALFPNCVTESLDKDGNPVRAVDKDLLMQEINSEVVEGQKERYQFNWPGKRDAIRRANAPTTMTLRPCKEESVDFDNTENLYIEGDNLEVLKLLQNNYLGKVKMIYIDPPYNTGNDFVYNDDFTVESSEFRVKSGMFDDDGNMLLQNFEKNTESNGRFHTDWLNMMYPRLKIARNLLSDDGVIFISIDDGEVDNLKKICNEIFGENNLVAEIPWQSRASVQNDTDFSVNHEYICVYAKNRRQENRRLKESNASEWHKRDSFVCKPLPLDKSKFDNPDNDPRGLWKADPFDAPHIRPNLTYPITNPNTGEQHLPPRGRHWRISPEKFSNALSENRIVWTNDGKGRPQLKVFYEEKKEYGSVDNSWFSYERVGTATNGTKELMKIFDGESFFDTPKPTSLLEKLIDLANLQSDSIILDFFSGSATTAHAVMQLNAEERENLELRMESLDRNDPEYDSKLKVLKSQLSHQRKFIMVQLPEVTDEDSEAYKAGYKNICEIGKERIRRAGDQILELSLQNLEKEGVIEKIEKSKLSALSSQHSKELSLQNLDGVDSVEYCREAISGDQGVYPVFENSKGITSGTGNTIVDLRTLEILNERGYRIKPEALGRNQQNDLFADKAFDIKGLSSKLSVLSSQFSVLNSDIGFRVLKVDDSNMKDVYYSASEYDQSRLDMFESNIKEDRNDLDLLFGCLLDWGLPLSLPYTSKTVGKYTVHTYNGGDLVACFDEDVSEELVKEIARTKPLRAVFRDSSFSNSASKINVFEIFKMISPETSVKVI